MLTRTRLFLLCGALVHLCAQARSQDTFSLLAYDKASGAVVSVGASCIDRAQIAGGASIISSVHPGRAVVHTQSIWEASNQLLADSLVGLGLSAKHVLDQVLEQDVAGVPGFRQYAVLVIAEGDTTLAAHTGTSCFPWAGHVVGSDYIVAGNILQDSMVVLRMEAAFLEARAAGAELATAALASLAAVAYPGADRRCTSAGISSRSAFLRLAYPTDERDDLTLELVIDQVPAGLDPILELQKQFESSTYTLPQR